MNHNNELHDAAQGVQVASPRSALDVQIGGGHYKECGIQPVQFIEANHLTFLEGCVVKRVTRHNRPGGKGAQDIDKAIHELQLIKQLRYGETPPAANDNAEPCKVCKGNREAFIDFLRNPAPKAIPCCNGGAGSLKRCDGCLEGVARG